MAKQKESEVRKKLEAYALPRRIKIIEGSRAEAFKKALKELNAGHVILPMHNGKIEEAYGEIVKVEAFSFVVEK
jgi:hypothetical protein